MKFDFLRRKVEQAGNGIDRADIKKLGPPPWRNFYQLAIQIRIMIKYRESFFALAPEQIYAAVKLNIKYTSVEIEYLKIAMDKVWHKISPYLFSYKAIEMIPKIIGLVYFVLGTYDQATPIVLAKEYFEKLDAAKGKEWVEFTGSAYFPMFEEPQSLISLLKRVTT